ncbi:MAG: Methionine aminopeptidase [uncultured bacterium]|nr:MAG: Methionine aminopeptidase [uncultured bacterium]
MVKTEKEIAIMREAGKRLFSVMESLRKNVLPGSDTHGLDKLAEELVFANGGVPAFKGYGEKSNPFPATICASVNDEVVHGIPSASRVLKEGDILKIDIGMRYQGYFSDMARTFAVGKISIEAQNLIAATEQCFRSGTEVMAPGAMLSDYSKAVERYIGETGYSIVRNLVGHGIGKHLHEEPQIPNFHDGSIPDFVLEKGMVFALEPMINEGTYKTKIGKDGWVFKTADGKLSAHYENTVAITEDGVEILTRM